MHALVQSGRSICSPLSRGGPSTCLITIYLPGYHVGEVEIARICLRSTTSDVISLRARPNEAGIAYRIVDEYEGKFFLPITQSKLPLTLAELVQQFEDGELNELDWGGGLSLGYNNMNADAGSDFEELRHFTRISSSIYPLPFY